MAIACLLAPHEADGFGGGIAGIQSRQDREPWLLSQQA
jgi:hypothetical protein